MTQTKSYKAAQMLQVAAKLRLVPARSDHHVRGFIVDDAGRKLYPPVYFSKGRKDVSPLIADKIRKSLLIDPYQFDQLVQCRMSRAEYLLVRGGK